MDSGITSNPVIYGAGGYGRDGVTNWLDLAGLALVTGNGFGNNNRRDEYQQGLVDGTTAKYTDIVAAVNNIDQNLNTGFDRIANVSRTGSELNLTAINGVKDSVQASQFQTSLQTKELLAQGSENTQKILDKLCNQEVEALRTELANTQMQKELSERGLLTATGPNMAVVANHYAPTNPTHDINIVNQNVNAIGSQVGQMAKSVEALSSIIAGNMGK